MIDLSSEFGKRAEARLRDESTIWLTTVDRSGVPQPRPVWFLWDGQSILIFSQPAGAKVRHIRQRPSVALNFNTDEDGDNVIVIIGKAEVLDGGVTPEELANDLRKYREGIKSLGMTEEQMAKEYSVPLRITPAKLRGF